MKESLEAKERVEKFREKRKEIVNSSIYNEVYAI